MITLERARFALAHPEVHHSSGELLDIIRDLVAEQEPFDEDRSEGSGKRFSSHRNEDERLDDPRHDQCRNGKFEG